MSKNSTHPVSECNPEEGTQWSHPEQCPEERHRRSSQQRETHLAAKGNWQNIHGQNENPFNCRNVYKVYTRKTNSKQRTHNPITLSVFQVPIHPFFKERPKGTDTDKEQQTVGGKKMSQLLNCLSCMCSCARQAHSCFS